MSFIQFESGRKIDAAREQLREARTELLKRVRIRTMTMTIKRTTPKRWHPNSQFQAEHDYKRQQERKIDQQLRGDDQWMLPSVSEKIARMSGSGPNSCLSTKPKKSSKKSKHEKKSKKSKKEKKHRRHKHKSSDSDDTSDSDGTEQKIRKKKRKHRSSSNASDSSNSDGEEWVEKSTCSSSSKPTVTETETKSISPIVRDDWMSGMSLGTFTKKDVDDKPKPERKDIDSYDPSKSARELNPFWKNGGTGLPTFQKPTSDSDDDTRRKVARHHVHSARHDRKGNWRKKSEQQSASRHRSKSRSRTPERRRPKDRRRSRTRSPVQKTSPPPPPPNESRAEQSASSHLNFLTDAQMNELGAKIIKAEIMGNDDLAQTLKVKLEAARSYRQTHKEEVLARKSEQMLHEQHTKLQAETVLLTTTNSKGASRPVHLNSEQWGGRQGRKTKSKKAETHVDGDRVRYFADDDKYDIKQMVSEA